MLRSPSFLSETNHRPWPVAREPWIASMSWRDLLFLHWPLPAEALRGLLPPTLELETFNGTAWLGIVPFVMTDVCVRGLPGLLPAFPELNVRTYVRHGGRSGVWFFSLDASSRLFVRVARWTLNLAYYDARISMHSESSRTSFSSTRIHRGASRARFEATYQTEGAVFTAQPGSLEHWLTERYAVFGLRRGAPYRVDVHHAQWPLQKAKVTLHENSLTNDIGIHLPSTPPLAHYSSGVSVLSWWPKS